MISGYYLPFVQAAQQDAGIPPWVWILLFIIVVLLVWWWLTRSANEEPPHIEAHHEEQSELPHVEEPVATRTEEVAFETEPLPVQPLVPDDLTILEGIGPKVNSILQAAGIATFAQLAGADVVRLKEILVAAGLQFLDPTTWPEQAALAAQGKWDEFEKLTAALKGGRRVA
ncbi:MAG: hypothetical protein JXB15_01460 [Anaerolineales bacterium]|nr:hypothetical protein [Anaerolineales bacterium]